MPIAASARVHPTAIIDPRADIGDNVQIGPFVVVEGPVRIGADCIIRSHSSLLGSLTLGKGNDVGIGVVLGERPQHLDYKNEDTRTEIGDGNTFREHVTVHRGTASSGRTVIGNHNFFMAHTHVAHDCHVGNHVIMVNGALLAGHCVLEDRALMSGNTAIHQFVRMGRLSMLSGMSAVTKDIPPFVLAFGRDLAAGINKIGMRRAGMSTADIRVAQDAFRILYRSGLIQKLAVQTLEQKHGHHPVAAEMLNFIRASKRGFLSQCGCSENNLSNAA